MSKLIDLTGMKFNELTVLHRVENARNGKAVWMCRCDCGQMTRVVGVDLRSGHSKTCGCGKRQRNIDIFTKHGHAQKGKLTKEYHAWASMIARATNPKKSRAKDYSLRGITVCDRWLNSFENFLADVGPAPGPEFSIDRRDNDGIYEPSNVRWADAKTQNRNRRSTRMVTFSDETRPLVEWAEIVEVPYRTLLRRIGNLGWDVERALTEPVRRPRQAAQPSVVQN